MICTPKGERFLQKVVRLSVVFSVLKKGGINIAPTAVGHLRDG